MKPAIILLVLAACIQVVAQDRSTITVKKSEASKETVIVTAIQQGDPAKASFQLNCNKDASSCKAPEPGTYIMIRLPKNWGMYDCSNVDLYAASAGWRSNQAQAGYLRTEAGFNAIDGRGVPGRGLGHRNLQVGLQELGIQRQCCHRRIMYFQGRSDNGKAWFL